MLVARLTWYWWTLPTYIVLAGFLVALGVRELRRRRG
jgi:hypothetical protein